MSVGPNANDVCSKAARRLPNGLGRVLRFDHLECGLDAAGCRVGRHERRQLPIASLHELVVLPVGDETLVKFIIGQGSRVKHVNHPNDAPGPNNEQA